MTRRLTKEQIERLRVIFEQALHEETGETVADSQPTLDAFDQRMEARFLERVAEQERARGTQSGDRCALDAKPLKKGNPPKRRFFWPRLSYALNGVLICSLILGYQYRSRLFPVIPTAEFQGSVVSIVTPSGETVWSHRFAAEVRQAEIAPWDGRHHIVVAIMQDGFESGQLVLYDFARDVEEWRRGIQVGEIVQFYGEELTGVRPMWCNAFDFVDLEGDGEAEIAAAFRHFVYLPSCIRTFGRDGEVRGTYMNWGYLDEVMGADIDEDGRDEILACGTNNAPTHQGATVVLLDADHLSGYSMDDAVPRDGERFREGALARLVLPQWDSEIMDALEAERLHARGLFVDDSGTQRTIGFKVGFGFSQPRGSYVIVDTDIQLTPVRVIPHGWMQKQAHRWRREGITDRDFSEQSYWDSWLALYSRFSADNPTDGPS